MRIMIIVFISIFFIVIDGMTEEMITLVKIYGPAESRKVEKEILPLSTEQVVISYPLRVEFSRIEGIEKLVNIKRLFISYGVYDISFIDKFPKLEVLVIYDPLAPQPINFEILKQMPRLRILHVDSIEVLKEEIDFQNNQMLEYVYLGNIRKANQVGMYELTFKNVPKSLKYIDLNMSAFIKLNKKLLDSLKDVVCIVPDFDIHSIDNSLQVGKDYLLTHPNIKVYKGNELLPDKYKLSSIYKLFGSDNGPPLSKTERVSDKGCENCEEWR